MNPYFIFYMDSPTPSDSLSRIPIKVTFSDHYREYISFDLVVQKEYLAKIAEECKAAVQHDDKFSDKVYEEAKRQAFKPKLNFIELNTSLARYVCCSELIQSWILEHTFGGFRIISEVNVDCDDWSIEYFHTPRWIHEPLIDQMDLIAPDLPIALTIKSMTDKLDQKEFSFFLSLVKHGLRVGELTFESSDDMLHEFYGELDERGFHVVRAALQRIVDCGLISYESVPDKKSNLQQKKVTILHLEAIKEFVNQLEILESEC